MMVDGRLQVSAAVALQIKMENSKAWMGQVRWIQNGRCPMHRDGATGDRIT